MATVSFKTKHGIVRFQTKAKAKAGKAKASTSRRSKRPAKGKVPAHLRKFLFTSRTAKKASAKARRTRRR
jgi:hypothetical protein